LSSTEHPDTYLARKKIKEIFREQSYNIEEEVELDTVTNNMGEEIYPPYRADMILKKEFIIEFDSKKLHGTHRRKVHDSWRDKNIKSQTKLITVRLLSKDILQQSPTEILMEINSQLKNKTTFPNWAEDDQ
jgi:hypothetical protein